MIMGARKLFEAAVKARKGSLGPQSSLTYDEVQNLVQTHKPHGLIDSGNFLTGKEWFCPECVIWFSWKDGRSR